MTAVFVFSIATAAVIALDWLLTRAADRRLAKLIEAATITKAMLDGYRPVVTEPPKGMTMTEAQAEVDRIWASLQFQPKPGTGGRVN